MNRLPAVRTRYREAQVEPTFGQVAVKALALIPACAMAGAFSNVVVGGVLSAGESYVMGIGAILGFMFTGVLGVLLTAVSLAFSPRRIAPLPLEKILLRGLLVGAIAGPPVTLAVIFLS